MEKRCGVCKKQKEQSEFSPSKYTKDGFVYLCKECFSERSKRTYYENRKEILKKRRDYYAKNRRKMRERYAKWYKENYKEHYERHKEKNRARARVKYAIQYGHIEKPSVCSRCGADGEIHGHHTDYSKPLEVVWLCRKCHEKEHHKI